MPVLAWRALTWAYVDFIRLVRFRELQLGHWIAKARKIWTGIGWSSKVPNSTNLKYFWHLLIVLARAHASIVASMLSLYVMECQWLYIGRNSWQLAFSRVNFKCILEIGRELDWEVKWQYCGTLNDTNKTNCDIEFCLYNFATGSTFWKFISSTLQQWNFWFCYRQQKKLKEIEEGAWRGKIGLLKASY